jgi:transposase
LLFSTAEQTGNVSAAARRAHVGRGTYYYWRPRYRSEGAAGLATERSRAPHRTRIPPVRAELREEVLTYHRAHPTEGYRTVAHRICQAHHRQKVIGHTKVGEIIRATREADLLIPRSGSAGSRIVSLPDRGCPCASAEPDAQY